MEFVSAGAEELTGYTPEELVGNARLAYADLVVPWHCESVCRDIQAAVDRHNAWTTSYPIVTASGERKWVWERGVAVLDENGEVRALEELIVDMTPEREIEEALESALVEWRRVFDVMDESVMVLRRRIDGQTPARRRSRVWRSRRSSARVAARWSTGWVRLIRTVLASVPSALAGRRPAIWAGGV